MSTKNNMTVKRAQRIVKEKHISQEVNRLTAEMTTDRFNQDMRTGCAVLGISLFLLFLSWLIRSQFLGFASLAIILTFVIINVWQTNCVDPKLQAQCFWVWGLDERFLCKQFCFRNGIKNHIKLTK